MLVRRRERFTIDTFLSQYNRFCGLQTLLGQRENSVPASIAQQSDLSIDHTPQIERTNGWPHAGVDVSCLEIGRQFRLKEAGITAMSAVIGHSVYYTTDQKVVL